MGVFLQKKLLLLIFIVIKAENT